MNLLLHNVISDLTGVTGLRIVRDILAGVRDPEALAAHRDYRCRAPAAEIAASLTGHYRPEHLFALRQNLEAYEFLKRQIDACDTEIDAHLTALAARQATPPGPLPAPRRKIKPRDNDPRFEIRSPLHRLTGTDLRQIDAIGPYSALRLVAEIGTDMTRWRTEKHFTAWLTLAPKNKVSGGRLLSSKTQPSANRAAAILRRCAMSLGRTLLPLVPTTAGSPTASANPRRSRQPLASSPSSSTASCAVTFSIAILAPSPTNNGITLAPSALSANAPSNSASASSTSRPARSSTRQFLRRRPPLRKDSGAHFFE